MWLGSRMAVALLTAFDMFPQTAHVETVCELVRGAGHAHDARTPW